MIYYLEPLVDLLVDALCLFLTGWLFFSVFFFPWLPFVCSTISTSMSLLLAESEESSLRRWRVVLFWEEVVEDVESIESKDLFFGFFVVSSSCDEHSEAREIWH